MEADHGVATSGRKPKFYLAIVAIIIVVVVGLGFLIYQSGYLTADNNPTYGNSSLMTATCSSLGFGTNSTAASTSVSSGASSATGSSSTSENLSTTSSSSSSHAYFLVIEADPGNPYEGMNGSAYHSLTTPWPVMHVLKGQTVTIHVINCASSEPHGFAIDHYFNSGLTAQPGGSYYVTFTADQTGTFRVYCNVACAIHPLMENGELIVS